MVYFTHPLSTKTGDSHKGTSDVRERWGTVNEHPTGAAVCPTVELEIPQWGVIFSQPPEEALTQAELTGTDPVYDVLLNGHLVITLPDECPPQRCKSIIVGFRVWSLLDLGPGRGKEEDMLFKREINFNDETQEGILLERYQRFEFSLILPSNLAPRDWHPVGRIGNTLYAEIEGVPIVPPAQSESPRTRSPGSPRRLGSPRLSPAGLFARFRSDTSIPPLAISEPVNPVPLPPEYVPSTSSGDVWIQGTHRARRIIRIAYNPEPSGSVNTLDLHNSGVTPALGSYEIRLFSDVWTIAAGLRANVAILDIPPSTTIFSIHVTLCQTTRVRSPRDGEGGKELVRTRRFVVVERGKRPPPNQLFPDTSSPAIYRGRGAGGKDDGALIVEMSGRVAENDYQVRPSTTRGVQTPIHVSHVLQVDMFFSVYGLDSAGKSLHRRGAGGLQVMRVSREVMLPACAVLPSMMKLPEYEQPGFAEPLSGSERPWHYCACYATMEEIEERLRSAAAEEQEAAVRAEHEKALKEQWEQGNVRGESTSGQPM